MTTAREQYLLERCLRLEARVAELEGFGVEPAAAPVASPAPVPMLLPRRIIRTATTDEITQMRVLRRRGLSPFQIGIRMQFSDTTVRRHTKDVLMEIGVSFQPSAISF